MENEKLQINMAPGADKAEIIIREVSEVNELPVKPPVKINIKGVISAPAEFLCKRRTELLQVDQMRCHVLIDREAMTITLITDEHAEYTRGVVVGQLIEHPKFTEFRINSESRWEPNTLGQFIKMNRAYFTDKAENMKLVTELKSFVGKVNSTIENEKKENGSFKDNYSGVVTSNLPGAFKLNIPLFRGGEPEEIEVEFYANVNGRDFTLQLYSPGAAEAMEKIRDEAIDEQIQQIRTFAPGIVIIEQ